MTLASSNNRAKNVRIGTVVISELKLRDVQRHIFGRHLVKSADHAALKDAPKAFNRVGMNRAVDALLHVLFPLVINRVVWIFLQYTVALPFVGREEADFVQYGLADKFGYVSRRHSFQNARDDVALTAHRANDWRLARASAAAHAVVAFHPVAIVVFATNPGFVNLDNTAKLFLRLDHCSTDFVAHAVRSLVTAETHLPLNLKGADTLFAGSHQVHDLEPLAKRLVRVLKDRARDMREAITLIRRALVALPLVRHRADREDFHSTTARANDASGPAALHKIRLASFLIGEGRFELAFRHLVDGLWALGSHGGNSFNEVTVPRPTLPVKRQIIASTDSPERSIRYGRPDRGTETLRRSTGVTRAVLSPSSQHLTCRSNGSGPKWPARWQAPCRRADARRRPSAKGTNPPPASTTPAPASYSSPAGVPVRRLSRT